MKQVVTSLVIFKIPMLSTYGQYNPYPLDLLECKEPNKCKIRFIQDVISFEDTVSNYLYVAPYSHFNIDGPERWNESAEMMFLQ